MSKGVEVDSSLSERPEHQRPRRLADWINPTGERKVHSLIDTFNRTSQKHECVFVKAGCGVAAWQCRVI